MYVFRVLLQHFNRQMYAEFTGIRENVLAENKEALDTAAVLQDAFGSAVTEIITESRSISKDSIRTISAQTSTRKRLHGQDAITLSTP